MKHENQGDLLGGQHSNALNDQYEDLTIVNNKKLQQNNSAEKKRPQSRQGHTAFEDS